jgi:hypothetical protein
MKRINIKLDDIQHKSLKHYAKNESRTLGGLARDSFDVVYKKCALILIIHIPISKDLALSAFMRLVSMSIMVRENRKCSIGIQQKDNTSRNGLFLTRASMNRPDSPGKPGETENPQSEKRRSESPKHKKRRARFPD